MSQRLRSVCPELWRRAEGFLLSRQAAGRSTATITFYQHVLQRFAECTSWPPTEASCQRFFLRLRKDGLSEATVHTYDGAVRVFLAWCVETGALDRNPMRGMERQKKAKSIPRAVPKGSLTRLFETMRVEADRGNLLALRDHALFRLIYDCGLRCSEAAGLEVIDLDLGEQSAQVRGKGGEQRVVYFGQATRQALRYWLDMLHPGCRWVFVSVQVRRGLRPLTRNGVNQALHRWCERAGIGHFRVHDLRHSYARHALRAGIDVEMVSRQLGHHDAAFTLQVYSASEDRDRRAVHLRLSPGDHLDC